MLASCRTRPLTYWTTVHHPLYALVTIAGGVTLLTIGGFLLASGGWHVAKAGESC